MDLPVYQKNRKKQILTFKKEDCIYFLRWKNEAKPAKKATTSVINSSRDVTPRESDVDFASDTEAADFSPEELIWGVAWLCEWDWLVELEVERLVEREVDSEESWLAFDEASVLAGSWRLAEADPYTTVDSFTAFEAKAEADDQFGVSDIEWLDEVDLSVEVEDWL